MTADFRFQWRADFPDEVTVLVHGDNGWLPVIRCDIAAFDAQWAAVKAEKWAHEMRQEANRLRTAEEHRVAASSTADTVSRSLAAARERRQESSRRFEQARFEG